MIEWSIIASHERVMFFENAQEAIVTFHYKRQCDNGEGLVLVQGDDVARFLTLRNTAQFIEKRPNVPHHIDTIEEKESYSKHSRD